MYFPDHDINDRKYPYQCKSVNPCQPALCSVSMCSAILALVLVVYNITALILHWHSICSGVSIVVWCSVSIV